MLKLKRVNVIAILVVAIVVAAVLSIAVFELLTPRNFSGADFYVMAGWPASLAFLWYALALARLHMRDLDVIRVEDGRFIVAAPLGVSVDLSDVVEIRLGARKALFWEATFLEFETRSGEKAVPLNGVVGPASDILEFAVDQLERSRSQTESG